MIKNREIRKKKHLDEKEKIKISKIMVSTLKKQKFNDLEFFFLEENNILNNFLHI